MHEFCPVCRKEYAYCHCSKGQLWLRLKDMEKLLLKSHRSVERDEALVQWSHPAVLLALAEIDTVYNKRPQLDPAARALQESGYTPGDALEKDENSILDSLDWWGK
jgi:hypothetical protein